MKKETRALRRRSKGGAPHTEPNELAGVDERGFLKLAELAFSEWNSVENEKQFRDL
jgi:hypothetical protein